MAHDHRRGGHPDKHSDHEAHMFAGHQEGHARAAREGHLISGSPGDKKDTVEKEAVEKKGFRKE